MREAEWHTAWLADSVIHLRAPRVWRGVETQYASSTLLLVNSLAEQAVLEELLEGSKPPLPATAQNKHFLLFTPFRYTPQHASRFRPCGQRGIWYGAFELATACAEVAYWRAQFIRASSGLQAKKAITHHTFFAARVEGRCINLMRPPWNSLAAVWQSGDDYTQTQRLALAAEAARIQIIQYESVRAPGGTCLAVFTPAALSEPERGLDASRQKWTCSASRDRVMMTQDDGHGRFEWSF